MLYFFFFTCIFGYECKIGVRAPAKVLCLHTACEHASREDVVVSSGDGGSQGIEAQRRVRFETSKHCVFLLSL